MAVKKSKDKVSINQPKTNLVFHFIDPLITIHFEEDAFTDEEENEISDIVFALKQSIWIDKTYVGYASSKYSDVFLAPAGWKQLCDMLVCSDFGRELTLSNQQKVVEAYSVMVVCYLLASIEKYGISAEHIGIEVVSAESIDVEIFEDHTPDDLWKKYPGKWQSWTWKNSNYLK